MTDTNPTINDVVRHVEGLTEEQYTHLVGALIEREEALKEQLGMAGMQFGLFPQIVAEVLAEIGMGAPMTDEQRAFIRAQYVALMEAIERQQRSGGV